MISSVFVDRPRLAIVIAIVMTIAGALSGSPAASAGLTEGDTITSVGGQSVSSASDISQILVKYHPGDKISISWVDQSGQSQTATVTLASGPAA